MRILTILALILLIIVVYLNRTYGAFFDTIGKYNLPSPFQSNEYVLFNEKSSDTLKIAFLGDSLTAGVGASSVENTFSFKIAEKLHQQKTVSLLNNGFPSAKVADIETKTAEVNNFEPTKVVILIGINDLFNRTPIDRFSTELTTIVTELKKERRQIYLLTIPYLGSKKAVAFPYPALYDYQLQRYNKAIGDVAQKTDIQLIDLYTKTVDNFKTDQSLYASDQFHPSEKGYILFADSIYDAIANN